MAPIKQRKILQITRLYGSYLVAEVFVSTTSFPPSFSNVIQTFPKNLVLHSEAATQDLPIDCSLLQHLPRHQDQFIFCPPRSTFTHPPPSIFQTQYSWPLDI